ncbi:hypothetical protein HanIR_Chr05g0219811 [Helianthus annuus]|nr:hypothetical protein HanIR_Chr15g0764181 [Helianthus annuus]KAJ0576055.1 hypothetical protein HanIR_Chr05g0219811 [Helianthus annuus]
MLCRTIGTQWELAWRRIVVGQGLLQDYVKLETFGTYVITLNLCFRLQLKLICFGTPIVMVKLL